MPERFSIALATCDGGRYLPEFLESLVPQYQLISELVVSDDASSDDTEGLLAAFAERAPFPVRILRNSHRFGVSENFSRAISACTADSIALADQDDVWKADKLEKLASRLAAPDTLAVFSDAEVVDQNLESLGYTMWQRVHFTPSEQSRLERGESFAILLKHCVVTGAALAFKASLRDSALPIATGWPHDAWLALLAAARGGLVALPEPLIAYRQHADNVTGGRRKSLLNQARSAITLDRAAWYRKEVNLWRSLATRINTLSATDRVSALLAGKIEHLEARATLPAVRWRRLPGVMREVLSGRYARYARNSGSIAIDLLVK